MNGTIDHGLQFLSPARRDLPTTYYGPDFRHRDNSEGGGSELRLWT